MWCLGVWSFACSERSSLLLLVCTLELALGGAIFALPAPATNPAPTGFGAKCENNGVGIVTSRVT